MFKPSCLSTWIDVVEQASQVQSGKIAYIFLPDGAGNEEHLKYSDLANRAKAVAARLQQHARPGDRALLLYPSGLDYIIAFLGCTYAGIIAVPAYPPHPARANQNTHRLRSIITDAQPTLALTNSRLLPTVETVCPSPILAIATDMVLPDEAAEWRTPDLRPDSVAFLQYTSGSTSLPKGVMVTHRNLLENERIIGAAFGHTSESIVAGWLPFYHDMGLIGNVLQPLYQGATCVLMPPMSFLQDPFKWLSAISRYRATTSGGPNFAYELCVQKISSTQREVLDLSSWRVAFNGAEPVRHETLERFASTFASSGFRRKALFPCYGLAEATLFVSGGPCDIGPQAQSFLTDYLANNIATPASPGEPKSQILVSCGTGWPEQKLIIVHSEKQTVCVAGEVGEIWVSSECICQGYWNKADESQKTFSTQLTDGTGPFLRTGDLGFILNEQLFVSGRLKDLIIIRGRNHYPQDIEQTVSRSHPALHPESAAAFSIDHDGEEKLVIVQELERNHQQWPLETVAENVRDAVSQEHELQVYTVVLIRRGTIYKTSSGKIQRQKCKIAFLENSLQLEHCSKFTSQISTTQPALTRAQLLESSPSLRTSLLEEFLATKAAQLLRIPAEKISPEKSLSSFGLDSLSAIDLVGQIETHLGLSITMTKVLQGVSIRQLTCVLLPQLENPLPSHEFSSVEIQTDQLYPLSPQQEALWLFDQGNLDQSQASNILIGLKIKGPLDMRALERALNEIVHRHPSLRTNYVLSDGQPRQMVKKSFTVSINREESKHNEHNWDRVVKEKAASLASTPFDLESGILFRNALCRRDQNEHLLLMSFHHMACDGWSIKLFLEELKLFYGEFSGGAKMFQANPPSYLDYVLQQQHHSSTSNRQLQLDYWINQFQDLSNHLDIPTDRPRGQAMGFHGAQKSFSISSETVLGLKALCGSQGTTLFMVLLAAYKALLRRYSGATDLVVGTSVANRSLPFARVIGPFTNALALRTRVEGDPTFLELLAEVRKNTLNGFENQDVSLEELLRQLRQKYILPINRPLFDTVFLLQNFLTISWEANDTHFELEDYESGMSNMDLGFLLYEKNGEILGSCRYRTELFEENTISQLISSYKNILEKLCQAPSLKVSQLPFSAELETRCRQRAATTEVISIAATFTAELLQDPLLFWMNETGWPIKIRFAPFNQVFQQLLDPNSVLATNRNGTNLLLLRLTDWLPKNVSDKQAEESLQNNIRDLIAALGKVQTSTLVFICPSPVSSSKATENILQTSEELLQSSLVGLSGVSVIHANELMSTYPVSRWHDPDGEQLGHLPFTEEFFIALATMAFRKIHALRNPPCKVLVLDCDNTLWKGVCAEDGALQVEFDSPAMALQRFAVHQYEKGMLICLASKNQEADVFEVFSRSDSTLQRSHLTAWEVNWKSKVQNLQALARKLNLGLSSFVFFDDNPVECAEVRALLPEVTAIQLPTDRNSIPSFLEHLWIFDRAKVTNEDRQRTALYQANIQREHFRQKSLNLDAFLAGLKLETTCHRLAEDTITRAAQLTQRTNQFNTTGIRMSEAQLQTLTTSSAHWCAIIEAKDRFGDYGYVGLLAGEIRNDALRLDNFLLSCRALGKGIEYKMLSFAAEFARSQNLHWIELPFAASTRNQPALNFVQEIATLISGDVRSTACFRLPVEQATQLQARLVRETAASQINDERIPVETRRFSPETTIHIAEKLRSVQQIAQAIHSRHRVTRSVQQTKYVEPRTEIEELLVEIWMEVLKLDRVGVLDNFFELGGHSLLATVLISRIRKVFDLELSLHIILERPTIADLAIVIENELIGSLSDAEIEATVSEFNSMEAQKKLQTE